MARRDEGSGGPQPVMRITAKQDREMWQRIYAERRLAQKKYQAELNAWQQRRRELIEEYFVCPGCGNKGFQTTMSFARTEQTTGGINTDRPVFVCDGGFCTKCTRKFGDPAAFTARSEELAPLLAEHEKSRPEPPKS